MALSISAIVLYALNFIPIEDETYLMMQKDKISASRPDLTDEEVELEVIVNQLDTNAFRDKKDFDFFKDKTSEEIFYEFKKIKKTSNMIIDKFRENGIKVLPDEIKIGGENAENK